LIGQRHMPLLAGLRRPRWPRWLRPLLASIALLLVLYALSPYFTLWQLDQAVAAGSPAALEGFVDLGAVRSEIRRRLNKDRPSRIGEVSDGFIDWLQQGLRRGGTDALEQSVSMDWLHRLLLERSAAGPKLIGAVDYAFFDGVADFHVRIGAESPLHLHLEPGWRGWQITAAYY